MSSLTAGNTRSMTNSSRKRCSGSWKWRSCQPHRAEQRPVQTGRGAVSYVGSGLIARPGIRRVYARRCRTQAVLPGRSFIRDALESL